VPEAPSNELAIRALIDNWATAIRAKDIVRLQECYAPMIDFYGLHNVPRERGTNALARAFTIYSSISIQITNLIFKDVSENHVTADFDKEWDFRGTTNFAGSGRQEMRFTKDAGQWLISSETELGKPYWVRHPK
jgi:ketosteroid isomerase-like protein